MAPLYKDKKTAIRSGQSSRVASGRVASGRSAAGQAMAELAFILPMFFALVFGVIEMSRLWATKHALTAAAREGARILVLPSGLGLPYTTEAEVRAAADERIKSYMKSAGLTVVAPTQITTVRVNPGADNIVGNADDVLEPAYAAPVRGDRVGVVIRYHFDTPIFAILGMFRNPVNNGENALNMGATCYMDHE
jgi:hypothetical protein